MATHSSILAGEIPWTEEPGGLHGVAESDTTEHACIIYFNGKKKCNAFFEKNPFQNFLTRQHIRDDKD